MISTTCDSVTLRKHEGVKERPILFSAPMVRAILEGRKTQTRRVMKSPPPEGILASDIRVERYHPTIVDRFDDEQPGAEIFGAFDIHGEWGMKCPYGQPGDRLWVRETWGTSGLNRYEYRAHPADGTDFRSVSRWRPSIHMPRWASRISLEITGVRVERLNDISEADAYAEGVESDGGCEEPCGEGYSDGFGFLDYQSEDEAFEFGTAKESFRSLWESINGSESWSANPLVWVVEFKRVGE